MGRLVTDDGVRLSFDDQGDGPPVLALAGLTRNRDDFQPLLPALAHFRVVRLDSRGRGESEADPSLNYTIFRETQDVICLLDHLNLARTHIIGTSRGGLLAMMLAAMQPTRINSLILNDIGPVVPKAGLDRILDYVGTPPAQDTIEAAAQALQLAHAQDFPGVELQTWRAQAAARFTESHDGLRLRYDPALRQALLSQRKQQPEEVDGWPLFDAIPDMPLGLIWGQNSDILLADTVSEMQRRRPDMQLAALSDRGHTPFLDEPSAVSTILSVLGHAS